MFLLSFWVRVFLVWIRLWFSRIFFAISPRQCLKKNSLDVRFSVLSRSLCLRVWVDDVVCVVSLSSLFRSRDKAQV